MPPAPDPTAPAARGRIGRAFRSALLSARVLAVFAPVVVWAVGQWWRDETKLTGMCFYTPSPLLAAWLLLASGWDAAWGRRRLALVWLLLAAAPLAMVAGVENQWRLPAPPASADTADEPLHVVHWNVQWGDHGWDAVVDRLLELDADAYFLSEVDGTRHDLSRFAGYEATQQLGMAVVARGELTDRRRMRFWMSQRVWSVDWLSRLGPVRVLMVDVSSFPTIHRDPQLRRVVDDMARLRPDLVVGDFNSPRRSRRLTPPPPGYRHAYEAAGAGWSYTWPVPAPVFAIDQLLVGERVTPLRYELRSTRLSDHRMQSLRLLLAPADEDDRAAGSDATENGG